MITIKDIIEFVKENGEYEKSMFTSSGIYRHTYTYTVDNYTVRYETMNKVFSGTLKLCKNGVEVNKSYLTSGVFCTDDELNEALSKFDIIFEVIDYCYHVYTVRVNKEKNKKRFLNKFMGKE